MSNHIVAVDSVGRGLRARRVRFDDDTERLTTASAAKALSLESGMRLSLGDLEATLAEIEPELARNRALRLLGYRERSALELTRRLVDDGFPHEVAGAVVESLKASGLVDDTRFAETLVHTRVCAGYGSRRILQELLDNGFDRETASALLEAHEETSDEPARLRTLCGERPPRDRRERERLIRKLVTKGFPPGAVLDALRDLGEMSDDEPTVEEL